MWAESARSPGRRSDRSVPVGSATAAGAVSTAARASPRRQDRTALAGRSAQRSERKSAQSSPGHSAKTESGKRSQPPLPCTNLPKTQLRSGDILPKQIDQALAVIHGRGSFPVRGRLFPMTGNDQASTRTFDGASMWGDLNPRPMKISAFAVRFASPGSKDGLNGSAPRRSKQSRQTAWVGIRVRSLLGPPGPHRDSLISAKSALGDSKGATSRANWAH